jgi:hypothetical protein
MLSPEALAIIRVLDTAELNEASTHVEAKADRRRHRSSQVPERFVLPAAGELRDPTLRDQACAMIANLCQIGGRQVEGRTRRSGKRSSPTLRPELNAPAPRRNILRREAERNFVKRISIGWCKTTGKEPPRTARRRGAERDIGPFARLVRECLRLLGASYADPVALINEVANERKQRQC